MINEKVKGTRVSLFAVFDGHNGKKAIDFAMNTIIPELYKRIVEATKRRRRASSQSKSEVSSEVWRFLSLMSKKDEDEPKIIDFGEIIEDVILAQDKKLVDLLYKKGDKSGSTALIAIVDGTSLTVANVGDSRGVMCNSEGEAIPLSYDHKPHYVSVMISFEIYFCE